MASLISIYLMCLLSAASIESRFSVNDLLERIIVHFTLAAGQLLIAVQGLSLMGRLNGPGLILANILLTACFVGLSRTLRPAGDRSSWKSLVWSTWARIAAQRKETLVLVWPALALILITAYCVLGALMIPLGDSYHFEMPLFWIQNHSIAPFAVNNPRINTTSFLGEALALPGYLYLHTGAMFAVITFLAGVLCVGVVFCLARRMGCGLGASACAAAITLGFSNFALAFLSVGAGSYLAALWAGASLLFLIGSRPSQGFSNQQWTQLGCSLFCFLMACGAKNSTTLLAPVYLIAVAVTLKGRLFANPTLICLTLCGGIALLCSGVPWNYIANKLWYGDARGPGFMRETLARDMGPRAVWTRVSRGAVLLVFDTVWFPKSELKHYAAASTAAVRILGGQKDLAEDDDYYNFGEEATRPLKGCGLVGIAFLLPGALVGIRRSFRRQSGIADRPGSARFSVRLVLLVAFGAFVISHAVLRWQSIGMLRLMPAFFIFAAPLCALSLEKRWLRVVALGLLLLSTAVFLSHDLLMVGRRCEWARGNMLFKKVASLAREHTILVECHWTNRPPRELLIHEDYHSREICGAFLEGIAQPTVIGFVGGVNSEIYWLFGGDLCNRVIPIIDDRVPDRFLEPPDDVEYLVFSRYNPGRHEWSLGSGTEQWALKRDFRPLFRVTEGDQCVFAAYKREQHR